MSTPYETTRHRCDYCRRSYAAKSAAKKHEATCWRNPASQSCPTCAHHIAASWPKPERCAVDLNAAEWDGPGPDAELHYEWASGCDGWVAVVVGGQP